MKIKCVMLDAEDNDLTYGKVYEVEKNMGDLYYVKDDVGDRTYMKEGEFEVVAEQPSEYSGESLPTVGTVCTVQHIDENIIRRVEVMAYKYGYVWLFDLDGMENLVYVACDLEFEPIKSEKAKEVDKIASELLESVNKNGEYFKHLEGPIAEHLYNAGLRFNKDSK